VARLYEPSLTPQKALGCWRCGAVQVVAQNVVATHCPACPPPVCLCTWTPTAPHCPLHGIRARLPEHYVRNAVPCDGPDCPLCAWIADARRRCYGQTCLCGGACLDKL